MVNVSVLAGPSAIKQIGAEWHSLTKGSPEEVFSHPGWYQAWIESHRVPQVGLICARENGTLIGLLPLGRFRTDFRGLFFPLVAPFARGDYQPPLIAPGREAEVLPLMLDLARKHFRRPSTMWWPNIPEDHPTLAVLRDYCAQKSLPSFEEIEVAPRIRTEGRSFEEVEKGLPSNHRKDVRRQKRRLEEVGPVTLWEPPSLAAAEAELEDFFLVHDEKWLSQGLPGMFHSETVRNQFRQTMRHLWGNGMYLTTLRCGDTSVSYHFGFLAGGWIQWYRPSYRTAFYGYSPGKIHVLMLIEEACRRGWRGMDFLLGEEPYKLLWSNEIGRVVSLWAGNHPYSPSYLWFSKGKPYFRQRFLHRLLVTKAWFQKLRQKPAKTEN